MICLIGTIRGKILRSQRIELYGQNLILKLGLLLALSSCAFFSKEVGEKRHVFNQRPTKIIWLQIPGVTINHFSLVKLTGSIVEQSIPLESALCTGRAWNHSLFEVGPSDKNIIEMQLSGSRNTRKNCSKIDYVWSDLVRYGFTSGVYHVDRDSPLSENDQMCYEKDLRNIALWRSVPNKGLKIDRASKFHHQERQKQYFLNTAYYDKSCDGKTCHGDLEKISKQFMRIFSQNVNFIFCRFRIFRIKVLLKIKTTKLQKNI